MKCFCHGVLFFVLLFASQNGRCQDDKSKPVKIAVFIPLFVDSVYNGSVYTLGKSNLPKNILQGLEFYNGVMMAIDSLNQEGTFAEISIYDTKQSPKTLNTLLVSEEMNSVGLIIAAITNPAELKIFSEHSLAKNIPLISATYPNYVGVKENPFFVLLNSSFQAHLEGLHSFMRKNYATDTIVAVTRKGGQYEQFIRNYISSLNTSNHSKPLKLKWITVDENSMNISPLIQSLDSSKGNVVFVASPVEKFGLDVVRLLSSYEKYKTVAIGMPTWDNIKDLDKPSCKNVEIVFSTPFLYYSKNKELSATINSRYKEKFYSRPSDMVFKGFETVYHFTKLLVKHHSDLVNHLSDKDFTVFNEFKLEAVKTSKTSIKPDLLENKKLYFIKKQQGVVKLVI